MRLATTGTILEKGTVTLLARVLNWDGNVILPANVSSISYTAYTIGSSGGTRTPIPGHTEKSLVVADVLFPTLQNDPRWTADKIGYNFRYTVDVSTNHIADNAGSVILIAMTLMPVSGQVIRWDYALRVI